VNHAQLQARIVGLALELGLHCHHCPMLISSPGFPDLVIIGDHGVLWRELKIPPDRLTSVQRALGYRLQATGENWAVWTPADWESQRIGRALLQLAGTELRLGGRAPGLYLGGKRLP
jgi:hypothetical protein